MMTTNRNRLGIYIHIPFCRKKCSYCDFLSFRYDCFSERKISEYVDAIKKEIEFYSSFKDRYIVDTIFIGGGTPSIINPEHISVILDSVRENFIVSPDAEITIEVNPGTVTKDGAEIYQRAGINRISMGVQSFNDEILKGLGRIHNSKDAYEAYEILKERFENISIDLMFAIPGLSMDIWRDTLSKAVMLNPSHISFYSLQIEEGTLFFESFENGTLKETDVDVDRMMYHYAIDYLKAKGYYQYEISNASKEGMHSFHNMKYWSMDEYIGIGLGASSYLRPYDNMEGAKYEKAGYSIRFSNCDDMDEYICLSGSKSSDFNICACAKTVHENTSFDDASEFVFTGLRRTSGISFNEFYDFTGRGFFEIFGEDKREIIERWVSDGFAMLEEKNGDLLLSLTTDGFDISNSLLMEFV